MASNITDRLEKFILRQEKAWLAKIRKSQSKFYERVVKRLYDQLDREDGRIKATAANYAIASKLERLYRDFMKTEAKTIIQFYLKQTKELLRLNQLEFEANFEKNKVNRASSSAEKNAYLAFGYNSSSNNIINGGTLDTTFSDTSPARKIINTMAIVIGGAWLIDRGLREIRKRTKGGEGQRGSLEEHVETSIPEPFQVFDRTSSREFADGIGATYIHYVGGLIDTSRDFCIVRDDEVFTEDEVSKFGTSADKYGGYTNKSRGEFSGKFRIGYDPFAHLGGHRCRHRLKYIGDEEAFSLRPGLKKK